MDPKLTRRKDAITRADEELLATLGYKQEFRRAFTSLEVRPYKIWERLYHKLCRYLGYLSVSLV